MTLHCYALICINQAGLNVIKLSRWLSEVETILPASLSQRFILPRGAELNGIEAEPFNWV